MQRHQVNGSGWAARTAAKHGRSSLVAAAVAAALTAALTPGVALAQQQAPEADNAMLDEIVVTARKREESVQSVPVSIAVLGGAELVDNGVLRASELQFAVPGFYVQSYETRATITMRGIGAQISGSASSVATHVNGVYEASAAAQLNRLFDVERVEVVKGPQGTLYGRNSTGGALNIITRGPGQEFEADAALAYGTYDTVRFDGGVSVPFSDTWGMRVAATYAKGDGQFNNVVTGKKVGKEDFVGGRVTLAGEIGSVKTQLFVQYAEDKTETDITLIPLAFGTKDPLLGWDATAFDRPTEPSVARKPLLAGLTLEGDIGNGYSWRAITGYLDYEDSSLIDVNPRPNLRNSLAIQFPQFAKQFSQEIQFLYTGERMNWVIGGYYLDDEQSNERFADLQPAGLVFFDNQAADKTTATALFADLNYNLTEQLRLNVGARYNHEKVENSFSGTGLADGGSFDLSGTQGEPTWRLGLDYTIEPGLMVYGSVATGYQAGYFQNKFDPQNGAEVANEVDPENVTAFELGMKSVLPGDRGYFNVAAFYYDYRDMQVLVGGFFLLPDGSPDPEAPPFFYTSNAAKAEIYGFDAELTDLRVAEHLKFDLVAEYLHATYKDYQTIDDNRDPVSYDGNTLPRAPEWMLASAMTIDNLHFGDAATGSLRIEYNYRSKTYFTADNWEQATQGPVGLLNAFATVEFANGKWSVRAGGRNLTDEQFFDFHRGDTFANTGEFRTWEVGFSYKFK